MTGLLEAYKIPEVRNKIACACLYMHFEGKGNKDIVVFSEVI